MVKPEEAPMNQDELVELVEQLKDAAYNYETFGGARWAIQVVTIEEAINELLGETEGNSGFHTLNKSIEIKRD
jgi:hypothetical protein